MSSKEAKSALKEAREAIKNKDYKRSMKLCKSVLKDDKDNYMALVLLGVTLQEDGPKEQCVFAFRKATLSNPENPLAWQGLISYYEKNNTENANHELISLYGKLLELESDLNKYSELCKKLCDVAVKIQDPVNAAEIFRKAVMDPGPRRAPALSALASMLTQINDLPSDLYPLYESTLTSVLQDSSLSTSDYYKKYLKLLYKLKKNSLLINEAIKMHNIYESDVYPLEWISKVFTECSIENEELTVESDIEKYIDALLNLNPESALGLLSKGVINFNNKNYLESRSLLKKVNSLKSGFIHSLALLSKCQLKLYCYYDCEQSCSQGLNIISNSTRENQKLKSIFQTNLVIALSRQDDKQKLIEAIKTSSQLTANNENNEILISTIRAHIKLENYSESKECLSKSKLSQNNSVEYVLLLALLAQKKNQVEKALEMLQSVEDSNSAEVLIEIGKLHMSLGNKQESFISFLKAAKLDPNCYICFAYLGNIYVQNGDMDKARRCYQRAFKVNIRCVEAGIGLSNIYRLQKNWEANQQLLESTVKGNIPCEDTKWAWLQLGLHHLDRGNVQEAINSLRGVVRSDPRDSHCWEALADAYLARGAYSTAIKSYQHAAQLKPNALYALLQIATLKLTLSQFVEARDEFLNVVAMKPDCVPALKGLGETYLLMSRQNAADRLIGRSRDNAQNSVDTIVQALKLNSDYSCLWKILADACMVVATLPKKVCFIYSPKSLFTANNEEGIMYLERNELFTLSARCYCRALNLTENNTFLWFDLAMSYYTHSKFCLDIDHTAELREQALAIIKFCITKNSTRWQFWNLLGIIATDTKRYALAQHAFIKAIALAENNAITWVNLGALYLCSNDMKLSNEAFSRAQRADPDYVQSWIGQAMIAELLNHEDAMDLYRHSAQLHPFHLQAGLGYAHWVCKTLISKGPQADDLYIIKNMHAVPVATDSLRWYCDAVTDNPCALNMLGLLEERMRLNNSSSASFKRAFDLVNDVHRDTVITNYARVLVDLEKYKEAIDLYSQIKEANFMSGCGLALAYFKSEQFEESYSTYETAVHWLAPDDNFKSHVLVAMAIMAYMFQGPEDAKTLLFQCIQLQPPSVIGMFAACALGLLHNDYELSNLVLKELNPFKNNPEYIYDIAYLQSLSHDVQNNSVLCVRSLATAVHRHPINAKLWFSLACAMIKSGKNQIASSKCALASFEHGLSTIDVSKVLSLVSLCKLLSGDLKAALRTAQKAVHIRPTDAEPWTLLIASFLPFCEISNDLRLIQWLRSLIGHIRRKTVLSRPMSQWLSNHERKVTLMVDQHRL